MLIYIFAFGLALLLVFLYGEYRKRKNFDSYIKMDVAMDFPTSSTSRHSNRHGFMLFNIKEVDNRFRALMIDHVKIKSGFFRLRSFDTIYTKLPLPVGGTLLSIGVRKSSEATKSSLENCKVVVSGYLLNSRDNKVRFKRKLSAYYNQMKKVS